MIAYYKTVSNEVGCRGETYSVSRGRDSLASLSVQLAVEAIYFSGKLPYENS